MYVSLQTLNSARASEAANATWEVPILFIREPDDVMVSAPTKTRSTLDITVRTALSIIRVTSTPAALRSLMVRIPCLQGRDSVA